MLNTDSTRGLNPDQPFSVELTRFGFSVAMTYPDGGVGYVEPEGERFINRGTLAYSARHVAQAHADRLNAAVVRGEL